MGIILPLSFQITLEALKYCLHLLKSILMISASIFFGAISPQQVLLIFIIVLLLFGGRKIPELMRGLGSGIKEFKKATKEEEEEQAKKEE